MNKFLLAVMLVAATAMPAFSLPLNVPAQASGTQSLEVIEIAKGERRAARQQMRQTRRQHRQEMRQMRRENRQEVREARKEDRKQRLIKRKDRIEQKLQKL